MGAEDEATFGLIPCLRRGWGKRGSRAVVVVESRHQSRQVFGARSQRSFVFGVYRRKRQREFLDFLEKVQRRWGRVLLFVDNARAHRGWAVEEYLRRHRGRVRLEYFPKYSPELNPVEACWKAGRAALSNRLLRTVGAMQYHLRKTFHAKETMPKLFSYLC